MTRFLFIIVLGVYASTPVLGQPKNVVENEQTWFGYFNQTRFTNRSGLWFDGHIRLTDNFAERVNQGIVRAAYVYYLHDNVRLAAGYGYIANFSGDDAVPNLNEHRPWQQLQWFDKKPYFNMMQYLRLEQRFREHLVDGKVADDYQRSQRVRYSMAFTIPLRAGGVQPKTPFVFVSDELMVNVGKKVVNNYFDQNRFFMGFGYQFTKGLNAHLGYLNVFLERPTGTDFVNSHAVRLFVFHNLDFRKEN